MPPHCLRRAMAAACLASFAAATALSAPQVTASESEAEERLSPAALDLEPRSRRVLYSAEADGLWAAGATYKVRAASDGFTYYPFLGSDAPANFPIAFRLVEAELAGERLPLKGAAEVVRSGDRITLDRGPVQVTYDLDLDSVEQSFVLDAAGATGDLVLRLDARTDLAAAAEGRGLRFDGAHGGVHYSGAVVLDAAGRRAEIPTVFVEGQIKLTVPASFLASATGPIVVDPVLGTWSVDASSQNHYEPDVSYDLTTSNFLYVYEDAFSSVDRDIYFRTFTVNGVMIDEGYMLLSSDDCASPEVANHNSSNTCLCVFTREVGGHKRLWGRARDMLAGTLMPEFQIVSIAGADVEEPDVGGTARLDPSSRFLVVFTLRENGGLVTTRALTVTPTGSTGGQRILGSDPSFEMDSVAVSTGSGVAGEDDYWNIVFRARPMGSGGDQIRGVQINANGTLRQASNVMFSELSGIRMLDFDVSDTIAPYGHPPTYLVTYTRQEGTQDDTWVMTCRDNQRLFRFHLQALEHSRIEADQIEPRVSALLNRFAVSYLERQPTGLGYDVYITCLDLAEDRPAISERRALVGDTGALWSGGCALASRFGSGFEISSFVGCVWARLESVVGSTSWNVRGALFAGSTTRAIGIQSQGCVGTVNSTGQRGYILIQGTPSVNQPKNLVAGGLPPMAFGYFIVGSSFANVLMPGGSAGTLCLGGQIGRFSNFAASSGPAGAIELSIEPTMLPTPMGSEAAVAGTGRLFQLWHRDTAGGGPPTSNFTNAALVIFR